MKNLTLAIALLCFILTSHQDAKAQAGAELIPACLAGPFTCAVFVVGTGIVVYSVTPHGQKQRDRFAYFTEEQLRNLQSRGVNIFGWNRSAQIPSYSAMDIRDLDDPALYPNIDAIYPELVDLAHERNLIEALRNDIRDDPDLEIDEIYGEVLGHIEDYDLDPRAGLTDDLTELKDYLDLHLKELEDRIYEQLKEDGQLESEDQELVFTRDLIVIDIDAEGLTDDEIGFHISEFEKGFYEREDGALKEHFQEVLEKLKAKQ